MNNIFAQLSQAVNLTTLVVGIVIGAAGVLALQALFDFIVKHWKPIIILCAATTATAAVVLAFRGGF